MIEGKAPEDRVSKMGYKLGPNTMDMKVLRATEKERAEKSEPYLEHIEWEKLKLPAWVRNDNKNS